MTNIEITSVKADHLAVDPSEIDAEESLFEVDQNEGLEIIKISNSEMYISMFPDEVKEDDLYCCVDKRIFQFNISENDISYEEEESENSNDSQKTDDCDEYFSFFSDDEIDISLERNDDIYDPLCFEDVDDHDEKDKTQKTVKHRKKRMKLFSQKSWIRSEEFLTLTNSLT